MTSARTVRRTAVVVAVALVAALLAWVRPGLSAQPAAATGAARASASSGLPHLLAQARTGTAKYATNLRRAKKDGYQILTKEVPGMGYHYLNPNISGFDPRKPAILVYEHTSTGWQLGAIEWAFPSIPHKPTVPHATYGYFPAACHYKDGSFVVAASESDCPAHAPSSSADFNFWHPPLYTMHVWIWYPNPDGLFSSTNRLVNAFNAG